MKIYIEDEGDRSVGIGSNHITMEWEDLDFSNQEERDDMRKDIAQCFQDLCDNGRVGVTFEDECFECRAIMVNKKGKRLKRCPNKDCLSNYRG